MLPGSKKNQIRVINMRFDVVPNFCRLTKMLKVFGLMSVLAGPHMAVCEPAKADVSERTFLFIGYRRGSPDLVIF